MPLPFSNADEAILWMEALCRSFQVDPKTAEKALLDLRAAEGAIEASKAIFERSTTPMAQFHAVCTLQAAALLRWEDLSEGERHSLRVFIWDVLARRREDLDGTAAAQALRTFCVFWKRSWADEPEQQRRAVLAHLAELAASDNPEAALLAAKTARALVLEFGVSQASSLGLPLEFHRRARRAFEEVGLDQCLALGMDLLGRVTTAAAAGGSGGGAGADAAAGGLEPALLQPASAAVELVTDLLSWEFNERAPWQLPRSDELVCPGPRWRQYLVRPDFLSSVFGLYERVRNGLSVVSGGGGVSGAAGGTAAAAAATAIILPHDTRQLLIQLASVHGDIFADAGQKSAYASFLLEGTTAVLAAPLESSGSSGSGTGNDQATVNGETLLAGAQSAEARDMTTMAARLLANFKLAALRPLPCFESFVRGLASLTATVLAGAVADTAAVARGGESWRHECIGVLLEAWGYIVEDRSVQTGEDAQLRAALSDLTRPLYEGYVAARIALARAEAATVSDEENSEEEYIESSDLKEQMSAAATLGRVGATAALSLLTSRLSSASRELATMVQTGAVGGRPALLPPLPPPPPGAPLAVAMASEFAREDYVPEPRLGPEACALLGEARVVVLLAGHLVADEDSGEASLVPEALLCGLAQEPQAVESLLRLVSLLADFLRFESGRLATSPAGADDPTLSPYLADGLLWCLARWARAYLLPDTHLYLQGSGGLGFPPQLLVAFGHAGGGGGNSSDTAAAGSRSHGGNGTADPWAMNGGSGGMNGGGSHLANGGGSNSGAAAAAVAGGPAAAMVATLLEAAWLYLCRWHGQPDVVSNALALLDVLASPQVAPTAWAQPRMAEIVAAHGRPAPARPPRGATGAALGLWAGPEGFRRLPTDARMTLASRLLKCALHSTPRGNYDVSSGGRNSYDASGVRRAAEMAAAAVAAPVRDRFARLVGVSEQMRAVQRQALEVVEEAVLCVALCRGVARASMEGIAGYGGGGNGGLHVGQEFVDPLLEGMVRLLRMNVAGEDGIVGEILGFFKDVSEVQLPSMSPRRAIALYDACGAALRVYADHHWGRHRGHDPTAEEDAYSDVLCVLQLLGLLVVKDLVDFGEDDQRGSPESERIKQVVPEVAFFGLSRVLPLMTEGLLQFPALAEHYLSLVGFVVEEFAERLPSLDFDLFRQLVQSLLFGSQQSLAAAARTSLKALSGVAEWHAAAVAAGGPGLSAHVARWPTLFTDCLGPLLRMLVFEPCVWDRLDDAADAVAALVACERAGFEQMAAQIIAQQQPQAGVRLSEAFRTLFSGETPDTAAEAAAGGGAARQNSRLRRARFHAKMREFVTSVRAFMLVA